MKKSFIPIVLVLLIAVSCGQSKTDSENEEATEEMKSSIEANKKIAAKCLLKNNFRFYDGNIV